MKNCVFLTVAVLVAACGSGADELTGGRDTPGGPPTPGADGPPTSDPDDPKLCTSREYASFDAMPLQGGRIAAKIGVDRSRMKPFSALRAEYARVLGAEPASLKGAGATFGQPPERWYDEPQASAVALQTAYDIAFDGCLTFTAKAPEFAAAPNPESAAAQCAAMARKFWSRTPAPQEVEACVGVATQGAASEPQPRRKWAYACASVLSAAGFLTY